MNDLMMNVLGKFFNKTEDELSALIYEGEGDELKIKENAAEALISLDEARITRIKSDVGSDATKKFDDGYKKAQKEVMPKFESQLKSELGFDSDLTGIELVRAWGETLGKETKVTAENIKTHPEFLKIETEWKKNHKEEIENVRGEFENFKSNVSKEQTMSKIRDMAETEFMRLNPVLSEDPAKKKEQTNMFLSILDNYNYDFAEDGSVVIMDGDKRLEDSHSNRVGFGQFIKSEAERRYDFQKQERRESPGNRTGGETAKTTLKKSDYTKKQEEVYASGDREAITSFRDTYTMADE